MSGGTPSSSSAYGPRWALLALVPLLLLAVPVTVWRYMSSIVTNPTKAWHIALMVDELSNVDANGEVNQTISTRAALARKAGRRWGCVLCRLLDAVAANHCTNSLPAITVTTPPSAVQSPTSSV